MGVIGKSAAPNIVHDRESVARYFGVSVQGVHQWARNGMPGTPGRGGGRGWYDLAEIGQWLYGRSRGGSGGGGDGHHSAPKGSRAQLEHYRALYWGLKCKRELGKVVPKEVLERECMARSSAFCAVLAEAPGVLAPLVAGKSVKDAMEVIRRWNDGVRRDLYGTDDDLSDKEDSESDMNEPLIDMEDVEGGFGGG